MIGYGVKSLARIAKCSVPNEEGIVEKNAATSTPFSIRDAFVANSCTFVSLSPSQKES